MSVLPHRLGLAALLLVLRAFPAGAQAVAPHRDPNDSITVTTLTFPGATHVSTDDIRRLLSTRGSTCRLPFLIPLCKLTPNQLFTDRRRTTEKLLGEDIEKIQVYLWQRGYREATVDTVLVPEKRGSAVAFRIVEGPPVTISALTVTQVAPVLRAQELADAVTLHEGQPLDLIALDTTMSRLHAAVWNRGYGDVRIDTAVPRPDASRQVPVRITIDPRWLTRVGDVHFQGNEYLSEATLRRGVMLTPGALYTRDAVLESQKRLFQNPAIARAVVITPPSGDSIKSVTVAVSEVPRHQASVTLGFNTIEYGQAAAELRDNGLGGGRWLSLRAAVGNLLADQLDGQMIFQRALPEGESDTQGFLRPTYQASLTLTQPWIGSARTSAAISAFAGRRSLPNVVIDEDAGATLGLVHELSPRAPIGLNYRFESTRVQGTPVYFCAGYGVCDASTRGALLSRQRLAPIGLSAWTDRSDDLESPTLGYTAVVDAEHASSATGSTFAHNRIAADASVYHSIGKKKFVNGELETPTVLALHGRAGWVRPLSSDRDALGIGGTGAGILHPRARFYAGGMQSVRGFAENELGPTVLQARESSLLAAGCTTATIASGQCDPSSVPNSELFTRPIGGSSVIEGSAELRVPLFKALGTVLFVDGAYVGVNGLATSAHGRGAVTPGAGFRYRSPLGVIRLDLGLRPVGAQSLPVVVSVHDAAGNEQIVQLAREKSYSPIDPTTGTLHSIARRLVVHFAMGQAF